MCQDCAELENAKYREALERIRDMPLGVGISEIARALAQCRQIAKEALKEA